MKALKPIVLVLTVTVLGACGKSSNGSRPSLNRSNVSAKVTCNTSDLDALDKTKMCQALEKRITLQSENPCQAQWNVKLIQEECSASEHGISQDVINRANNFNVVGDIETDNPNETKTIINIPKNEIAQIDLDDTDLDIDEDKDRSYETSSNKAVSAEPVKSFKIVRASSIQTTPRQAVTIAPVQTASPVQTREQVRVNQPTQSTLNRRPVILDPVQPQAEQGMSQIERIIIQKAQESANAPTQTPMQVQETASYQVTTPPVLTEDEIRSMRAEEGLSADSPIVPAPTVAIEGADVIKAEEASPGTNLVIKTVRYPNPSTGEVETTTTVETINKENINPSDTVRANVPKILFVKSEEKPFLEMGLVHPQSRTCDQLEVINNAARKINPSLDVNTARYKADLSLWATNVCSNKTKANGFIEKAILGQIGGRKLGMESCANEIKSISMICLEIVNQGMPNGKVFN